ncbi:MAG: hypothetical protein U0835_26590 [Isosphaeraceae bacterium]
MQTYDSRPVGIGGDEFFGGDNVTAAVYEILRDRLSAVLAPLGVRLPLAELHRLGHQSGPELNWNNSQRLLEAAEAVKRFACIEHPTTSDRQAVEAALEVLINRLRGERSAEGRIKVRPLAADEDVERALRAAAKDGRLLATSEEVERHVVGCDLLGDSNYTVEGRLRDCVKTLQEFAARAGAGEGPPGPHFIVLAGAGCRLPLATRLLRQAFPEAAVVYDVRNAKSKVAFGLFRYLDQRERFHDRVAGLAMACDYTHADIIWLESFDRARTWVPSCTALKDPAWFPLEHIGLSQCWDSSARRRIEVYRRTAPEFERLGTFDLSRTGVTQDEGVQTALPPGPPPPLVEGGDPQVWMRLDGAEDRLLLRVRLEGVEYGDWPLDPDRTGLS